MTKHGHGLPRKRPGRSAQREIEDELPALEPLDELPGLEPIPALEPIDDDGPVKVRREASDDPAFDTVLTVAVAEMPKQDVLAAVAAPLERAAAAAAAELRHRRVLVRFTGDALIGGAVKQLVVDTLQPHRPLLAVVRRGFGDERVLEGALPTVERTEREADGRIEVEFATGDCVAADLPAALTSHLDALTGRAAGRRFVFQFRGSARPDAALRDAIAMALRDAGARSAAIGARVLFDRDLEERVQCAVSGTRATIVVALTQPDAETIDALSLVLPMHEAALDGKSVRFQFARESAAVQAFCVDFAQSAGASLIEVGGQNDFDIVWPPLVRLVPGAEIVLRLEPNGRSRAAVLAAFGRECRELHDTTQGKDVVVDWPADFALDAEAVAGLDAVLGKLAPKRLACTVAGAAREPFVPEPVSFGAAGELYTVRIDSDAGRPPELQRALDRRLPAHLSSFRGRSVRIELAGDAAVSRSLVRSLCTAVAEAGAMRLEVQEGGAVDVLLPPMLAIVEGEHGVSITIVLEGRDQAQQQKAIARELEGIELALKPVTIGSSTGSSTAAEAVAQAALEQGAARVVLDGPQPLQIHPPLFEPPQKQGKDLRLVVDPTGDAAMDARMLDRELAGVLNGVGVLSGSTVTIAWPGADAAAAPVVRLREALQQKRTAKILLDAGGEPVQLHPEPKPVAATAPVAPAAAKAPIAAAPAARDAAPAGAPAPARGPAPAAPPLPTTAQHLTVLGRRDEAVPPLVLLGVAAGDDEMHVAAVEAELQAHLPRFRGRAVLLVPQENGADAPARRPNALVQMLGRVVPRGAAATLVFRGPDAQGRPHFQVLHSTLRALPVGGAFADPRASRQPG